MKHKQPVARLAHAIKYCSVQNELRVGSVYFIQCNEFVKIGYASDVQTRMANMQIGCPYQLTLLRAVPCMTPEDIEVLIHSGIEQYRVRGEWFKLPPDVLALLLRSFMA